MPLIHPSLTATDNTGVAAYWHDKNRTERSPTSRRNFAGRSWRLCRASGDDLPSSRALL